MKEFCGKIYKTLFIESSMGKILNFLRTKPKLYDGLKKIYRYTFGMWFAKEMYLRYIGLYNGKRRLKLLNKSRGNKIVSEMIKSGKPFMLARYGSSEFRAIMNDKDFYLACFYAGFFPQDKNLLKKFRKVCLNSSKFMDILLVWNYKSHFFQKLKLVKNFLNVKYIIRTIDIGFINDLWIKSLKGKKILVIHPFKKTIESQYKKRKELGILPKLKSFEIIKAVQTLGGTLDERFGTWFDALDYMKKEIDKKDFDVALIACGAYGLPLAAHVKSIGKQALHVGGGLQLLFGIKGKRWDNAGIYNESWVSPSKEDFLKNYKVFEGGCYW